MASNNSDRSPRAFRTLGYDFVPATETTIIPAGCQIRIKQRVYDLTDGTVGDLYIATLLPLPNGGFEMTTFVGEDEVVIEIVAPAARWRRGASGDKRGRRS